MSHPKEMPIVNDSLVIETEEGTARGFPLSDLQQNTLWLKRLVSTIAVLGFLGLFYLLYMTYYIINHNVVNNIVAKCI